MKFYKLAAHSWYEDGTPDSFSIYPRQFEGTLRELANPVRRKDLDLAVINRSGKVYETDDQGFILVI